METMNHVGVNCLWTFEGRVSFCLLSAESTKPAILGCSPPRRMGLLKYAVLLVGGQLRMLSSSCKHNVQAPSHRNGFYLLIDWLWWNDLNWRFGPLHSSNIKQRLCHWEMLCWDHNSFLRSQPNTSWRINFANSFNLSDTGDSLQNIWGFHATAKWKNKKY